MAWPCAFCSSSRSIHCALGPGEDGVDAGLAVGQRAVVEVGRVVEVAGGAGGVQLDVEHALGDDAALAGAGEAGVLDGVLQVEEHARRGAGVALVHQHGAALAAGRGGAPGSGR